MSLSSFATSIHIFSDHHLLRQSPSCLTTTSSSPSLSLSPRTKPFSLHQFSQISRPIKKITARGCSMEETTTITGGVPNSTMKLLFVEMGVGYDQHGQDITSAAMKACKNAISSNSIPAFRRGSIPGVSFGEMKLQIKLGVPSSLHQQLDLHKVKSIFPYGKILNVEVVDGGLICSSGVLVEEMGDTNEDCYIVNAAVYTYPSLNLIKVMKKKVNSMYLRRCGFALQGHLPDSDPPPLNDDVDSESDSLIASGGYDAVETEPIRFVSPPLSSDSASDLTVPVESGNRGDDERLESLGKEENGGKKKDKVPLRDIVKAIVMNSKNNNIEEEEEEDKEMSYVQMLAQKGFKFP